MKFTIIGTGIAGLTAAISLRQKGFDVELFEATNTFKKAGSGINLAINAMQVFKRLGLYEQLIPLGSRTNALLITDQKLKLISKIDLSEAEKTFDVTSIAIHRATLHDFLIKQLKDVPIYLDKKLQFVKQAHDHVSFTFKDGTSYTTNVLIGADGIHSVVRNSIFKETTLRIPKQICWRGIVKIDIAEKYSTELIELWGKGKRFGFVHINPKEVYWYALSNYKEPYKTAFKNVDLAALFTDFSPLVRRIITATNKNDIIRNEMMDLKPITHWSFKNICLLGDAAHATTPNMGQGACQSIESAYVLAHCLAEEKNIELAFENYQKIRKTTAIKVINTSWNIGKIAHIKNGLTLFLRNSFMRMAPKKLMKKNAYSFLKLNY